MATNKTSYVKKKTVKKTPVKRKKTYVTKKKK